MIILDLEQYSPEWWEARKGIPTGSRASKIITAKTGALSASARPYMSELIADKAGFDDRLEVYESFWMERGHEMEAEARRFFTFETGLPVCKAGFVTNDDGTAGCSPDSFVDDGAAKDMPHFVAGLEIKCPKPSTHIGYLLDGRLPDIYKQQVHWSLAVTGLETWYWMSYHPELDPVVVPVQRDEYTAKVEKALEQFIVAQCDAMQKLGVK